MTTTPKDEDELVEEEEEDSSLPQLEAVPGASERGSLHRQGSHVSLTAFIPIQIGSEVLLMTSIATHMLRINLIHSPMAC